VLSREELATYVADHRMHEQEEQERRQEERAQDLRVLAQLLGVKLGKG
jgi:hypothetical protein